MRMKVYKFLLVTLVNMDVYANQASSQAELAVMGNRNGLCLSCHCGPNTRFFFFLIAPLGH